MHCGWSKWQDIIHAKNADTDMYRHTEPLLWLRTWAEQDICVAPNAKKSPGRKKCLARIKPIPICLTDKDGIRHRCRPPNIQFSKIHSATLSATNTKNTRAATDVDGFDSRILLQNNAEPAPFRVLVFLIPRIPPAGGPGGHPPRRSSGRIPPHSGGYGHGSCCCAPGAGGDRPPGWGR